MKGIAELRIGTAPPAPSGLSIDARLLRILRESPLHLPEPDLAREAQVTPSEVRLRLSELQASGFTIEQHPSLGVRLVSSPDRLIADDLSARLGPSAMVRELVAYEELDSTNELALQQGRLGAAGGLVIFAERQRAGRGRFGRRWESASHLGIWFSLLLRPALSSAQWPRLTTWAGVAVAEALERSTGQTQAIKWPNDIYCRGRKVAGILIETGADCTARPFVVLGIGVNVNHVATDFPPELVEKAASLRMMREGLPLDRAQVAANILRSLEDHHASVESGFDRLVHEASTRSLLLGCWVRFRSGSKESEGVAEALDENGHLLLRGANGALERLSAGEVTLVDAQPPFAAAQP